MNENNIDLSSEEEVSTSVIVDTQSSVDQDKTNSPEVIDEKLNKKTPAWKWLLLIILAIGLVIFVMTTPQLSQHVPSVNIPLLSSSPESSSSSGSSTGYRQSNSDDGLASELGTAYVGMSLAMPISITIIAFATVINIFIFVSMSMNIGRLRSTLDSIYDDQQEKTNLSN